MNADFKLACHVRSDAVYGKFGTAEMPAGMWFRSPRQCGHDVDFKIEAR